MSDPHYTPPPQRNSGSTIAYIVGGLIVLALLIWYFVSGNDTAVVDGADGAVVEGAVDDAAVGADAAVDDAADAAGAATDDAATGVDATTETGGATDVPATQTTPTEGDAAPAAGTAPAAQ